MSNLVPGVSGSPDRDVFSGTSAQLAAMAVKLLPGDYNHDGVVDTLDYFVWRNSVGSTVLLAADGNNDGVVNSSDYTYWRQPWPNSGQWRWQRRSNSGSGPRADNRRCCCFSRRVRFFPLGLAKLLYAASQPLNSNSYP